MFNKINIPKTNSDRPVRGTVFSALKKNRNYVDSIILMLKSVLELLS